MGKRFKRTIEDFVCENCGEEVKGDGYTNHCPVCLCSKHVDVNPGDRENECGGLMKPVGTFLKNQKWVIEQKCEKCGEVFRIKAREEDSKERIEEIIKDKVSSI